MGEAKGPMGDTTQDLVTTWLHIILIPWVRGTQQIPSSDADLGFPKVQGSVGSQCFGSDHYKGGASHKAPSQIWLGLGASGSLAQELKSHRIIML